SFRSAAEGLVQRWMRAPRLRKTPYPHSLSPASALNSQSLLPLRDEISLSRDGGHPPKHWRVATLFASFGRCNRRSSRGRRRDHEVSSTRSPLSVKLRAQTHRPTLSPRQPSASHRFFS